MSLERFTEKGNEQSRKQEPFISLRASESLGVSQAALDEYLDEAEAVLMLYDEDENRIGIDPLDDECDHPAAYAITRTESSATIAPGAFLRAYDLVPEITTRYRPEWDDEKGVLLIDLDDPVGFYEASDGSDDEDEGIADDNDHDEDDEPNADQEGDAEDGGNTAVTDDSDRSEQGGLDDW